jgi:hypothetical protein
MTSITAFIPRLRVQRTGRIIAIRCTRCRTWRKPRHFTRDANTCHACVYGESRAHVRDRAARHS